jgi:hypothetical protein
VHMVYANSDIKLANHWDETVLVRSSNGSARRGLIVFRPTMGYLVYSNQLDVAGIMQILLCHKIIMAKNKNKKMMQ